MKHIFVIVINEIDRSLRVRADCFEITDNIVRFYNDDHTVAVFNINNIKGWYISDNMGVKIINDKI